MSVKQGGRWRRTGGEAFDESTCCSFVSVLIPTCSASLFSLPFPQPCSHPCDSLLFQAVVAWLCAATACTSRRRSWPSRAAHSATQSQYPACCTASRCERGGREGNQRQSRECTIHPTALLLTPIRF